MNHQDTRTPRKHILWFVCLLVTWCLGGEVVSAAQSSVTREAIWLMKRVGAPAPSPDGRWVVFSVIDPSSGARVEKGRDAAGMSARHECLGMSARGTVVRRKRIRPAALATGDSTKRFDRDGCSS